MVKVTGLITGFVGGCLIGGIFLCGGLLFPPLLILIIPGFIYGAYKGYHYGEEDEYEDVDI